MRNRKEQSTQEKGAGRNSYRYCTLSLFLLPIAGAFGPNGQVKVLGQQAVREEAHAPASASVTDQIDKLEIIALVMEDYRTGIAEANREAWAWLRYAVGLAIIWPWQRSRRWCGIGLDSRARTCGRHRLCFRQAIIGWRSSAAIWPWKR